MRSWRMKNFRRSSPAAAGRISSLRVGVCSVRYGRAPVPKIRLITDTIYVDNLIGPETVNTVPPQTLEAFKDHGRAEITIYPRSGRGIESLEQLKAVGINMDIVTQELEDEEVKAFADAFSQLLGTIEKRRVEAISTLGPLADAVSKRMAQMESNAVHTRLWAHDPTLWTSDPEGQNEVKIRMGWLELASKGPRANSCLQSVCR